jgi:poly(3-hydroxybutyrate) depolymerase
MKYLLMLLLLVGLAHAQFCTNPAINCTHSGSITSSGQTRSYWLYSPANLLNNFAIIFCLHSTVSTGSAFNPPAHSCAGESEFQTLAVANKNFVLVEPHSMMNTTSNQWYWNADFIDGTWNTGTGYPPNDIQFFRDLRTALIGSGIIVSGLSVDPNKFVISGQSSGGFMAQRAGAEMNDVIGAVAATSSHLWAQPTGSANPSDPAHPISIIMHFGDLDSVVRYCGGTLSVWNSVVEQIPSTDVDASYWLTNSSNNCNIAGYSALCSGSTITSSAGFDINNCAGGPSSGIEVKFVKMVGVGHTQPTTATDTIYAFLMSHTKGTAVVNGDSKITSGVALKGSSIQ